MQCRHQYPTDKQTSVCKRVCAADGWRWESGHTGHEQCTTEGGTARAGSERCTTFDRSVQLISRSELSWCCTELLMEAHQELQHRAAVQTGELEARVDELEKQLSETQNM